MASFILSTRNGARLVGAGFRGLSCVGFDRMDTDWQKLFDICAAWKVDLQIVLYPAQYRDDQSAAARGVIIRELLKAGVKHGQIASMIPLSARSIHRLGRGCLTLPKCMNKGVEHLHQ